MGTGVRILGGLWRRTPIEVPGREGLRPTGERVRETLYDWVQHLFGTLAGRSVLDLFAGSGALGLEAASRGAAELDAVELDRRSAEAIRAVLRRVKAPAGMRVHALDAWRFLREGTSQYDLILIDPPFALDLQARAVRESLARLKPDGLLYVESAEIWVPDALLAELGLVRVRAAKAGMTAYELLVRASSPLAAAAKLPKASKVEKKKAARAARTERTSEENKA